MTSSGKHSKANPGQQIWQKTAVLFLLVIWCVILTLKTSTSFSFQPSTLTLLFNLKRFAPFNMQQLLMHWLGTLRLFLLLIAMLLTAYGLGKRLLNWLTISPSSLLASLLYSLGLGFAGMSLISMALGFSQLYFSWIFIVLTLIGSVNALLIIWNEREQWTSLKLPSRNLTTLDIILVLWTIIVLLFVALNTNAPELFFDSLVYHLAVPEYYLQHHGIKSIPTIFFSNMPLGIEMIYAWCLSLADERLCRMIHATLGCLAGIMVYITARRYCLPRYALWAMCLFLLVPVINMNMQESGVDVGAAFFAVLAFDNLLQWINHHETKNHRQSWLTGLVIGFALFCKYTTAFILAPAVVISFGLAFRKSKQQDKGKLIKQFMLMSAGVLLIMSPLLIKNTLFTNNPVYPFLADVIPSKHVHHEKMNNQMNEFKEYGNRTWKQYLSQAWTLSFYQATSNSFIGVGFLLMLPGLIVLGFINRRGPPTWQVLYWSVVVGTFIWSTQTQITRYYIAIIPMLIVVMAILLEKWSAWHKLSSSLAKIVMIGLAIWCSLLFMVIGVANWDPIGASLGLESKSNYLNRKLLNGYYPSAQAINQLPKTSKIMIFGDTRSFYYNRATTVATVFDHHPIIVMLQNKLSAKEIWEKLSEQGYTHFFVHHDEASRIRGYEPFNWDEQSVGTWQELISHYVEVTNLYKQQILYKLLDQPNVEVPITEGRPLFVETFNRVRTIQGLLGQLRRQRSLQEGMAIWHKAKELAPHWWVIYHNLGHYHYQLKQYEEAYKMYSQADQLGWLDPNGYFFLGQYASKSGQLKLAAKYYRAALLQAPEFKAVQERLEQIERILLMGSQ